MKRLILLGTVAAIMTVMIALAAGPAMSKLNCEFGENRTCSGGDKESGGPGHGGFGQHTVVDQGGTGDIVSFSGGGGSRDGLRGGSHCSGPEVSDCNGRGFSGKP